MRFQVIAATIILLAATSTAAWAGADLTAAEENELQGLLLKRAQHVLPTPEGGTAHKMFILSKGTRLGTSPSEGCHSLAGTRHDPKTHMTYQLWKRCDAPELHGPKPAPDGTMKADYRS